MRKSRIIGSVIAALFIGGAVAAFAIAWRPAIAAIDPPAPQSFDPALVKRGRDLAAIGNCNDCHTVRGGRDFAGGLPVPTPFGTIYSSNITPDAETGMGRWSETAFRRAIRSGVNRDGQHLYPTFPYDHFTNVTDEDDQALYAYLMTRLPVHAAARENQLPFPLNQRTVIAGWKLLFLRPGSYRPDPSQSAEYNRGAYLVAGLAQVRSPPVQAATSNAAGAAIYTAACATCHESDRKLPYGGVNLGLSTAISGSDPRNAANIVLSGVRPVEGERSPIMPGFASSMNDDQISALLRFLRARFSSQPAWSGVEQTVADARQTQTVLLQASSGPHNAPPE